jgi:nucleolar protein 53
MPILKPATVSPGAPQQHRQHSRKGKKAWRKNVDVSDIQEGLEIVRDEVIKGYELSSIRCRTIIMTYNVGA